MLNTMNLELAEAIAERLTDLGLPARVHPRDDGLDVVAQSPRLPAPLAVRVSSVEKPVIAQPAPAGVLGLRHVTAGQAQRFRAQGQQYVDSGGNAYLDQPGLYVHVEGRKPTIARRPGRDTRSQAYTPAGLRVVFGLLTRPDLVGATMRDVARAARVSLGAAHGALTDLRAEGLVTQKPIGSVDTTVLSERWVTRFGTDLLPTLQEVRYTGPPPVWWRDQALGVSVAGDPALELLGYPIRPLTATLYADVPFGPVVQKARLRRTRGSTSSTDDSNVILRERFWEPEGGATEPTAPRLLVYADALATGDARQVDAARTMWETDEQLRRLRQPR